MGPVSKAFTSLSKPQAYKMAALLLLFNFDVVNLIQWLGRVYTHVYIPMYYICKAVEFLEKYQYRPDYPAQDYDRALHILDNIFPVTASYLCIRDDVIQRNLYSNH